MSAISFVATPIPTARPLRASVCPLRPATGSPDSTEDEAVLVAALRRGDREAFEMLIDRYHASMVRVARMFVRDRAVAEEVAQEAWVGVLTGLDRFEGRSSLKTWLFRILTNRAKTRAQREGRSIPLSAFGAEDDSDERAVDPARFLDRDDPRGPGAWASPPKPWETLPEERLVSQETLGRIGEAIEALPESQREVIRLRDVEGWSAEEVCDALGLTDGNQRVLLHRARSGVRQALEDYLGEAA